MFPELSKNTFGEHTGRLRNREGCVRAFLQVLAGNTGDSEEKREEAKERLLKYHDRLTGGIPGLLPLVPNLPIRFTDALGRAATERGAFKRACGILRGWEV